MPAKDLYHNQVRNALIKDGWRITRDTYQIKFKEIKLYADLAAESMFAAERDHEQIIVEVKSFLGTSRIRDFEAAIGQYILCTVYIRLCNGKVWVEEDLTEDGVTQDLLEAGIPQSDIVLGFQHPRERALTEFAVA